MAAVIVRTDEGSIDAHLAFTLKEAAYKAWSRLGGRMLDFHEVRLEVGADSFVAEVLPTGTLLQGRYVNVGDRWISLVVVSEVSEPTAQERGGSSRGH
jgi:4'-phosphopantetheinyl transferase EntD